MTKSITTGIILVLTWLGPARAAERTERFDGDPGWEGRNNRAVEPAPRMVRQDFGWSEETSHAAGAAGEVGGFVTPAAEAAYYALRLEGEKSFEGPLAASGRLMVPP